MQTNNSKEKVRQLQNKLYLTAKKCNSRRFHALYDKVYRDDVVYEAWKRVKKHQRRNHMSKVVFVRKSIYEKGLKKMARAWRNAVERRMSESQMCISDRYLRQAHPIVFSEMVLSETLYEHCAEIEATAKKRMDVILPQLMKSVSYTHLTRW